MSMKDLAAALSVERVPPCDRYSCLRRRECAKGEACDAFLHYVGTGEVVPPHAAFYEGRRMLHHGRVMRWRDEIVASASRFAAMRGDL